jgi:hypothetical protein
MKNIKISVPFSLLFALAPLACGDDGDSDTGVASNESTGSATDDPTTNDPTTNDPTTNDPTTNDPTTDDPTTTDGPTTDDPDTSATDPDTTGEPAETSQVRVMHLGVRAPAVDVFANGEGPVFEGLEFRNSTDYAEVPAGDYTFEVSVSGSPASEAVLAPELTLDPNVSYTAIAIGDLEETNGAPGLAAIAIVDNAEGIDAANVRITVIHAAPAVGQVDVWEISDKPVPLLENVDYSTFATLADIPAGPLEIGIDVDDDAMPDVTFSVDTTPLAGAQINVYANNDAEGNVALIAQLQDGTVLPIAAN